MRYICMLGVTFVVMSLLACSGASGFEDDACGKTARQCVATCESESSAKDKVKCQSWCSNELLACAGGELGSVEHSDDSLVKSGSNSKDPLADVLSTISNGKDNIEVIKVIKPEPKLTDEQTSYIGPVGWAVLAVSGAAVAYCAFEPHCLVAAAAIVGAKAFAYRRILASTKVNTNRAIVGISGIATEVFNEAVKVAKRTANVKNPVSLSNLERIAAYNQALVDAVAEGLGLNT